MSVFTITFVLSVLLIIGGFFCPPIGVIDGSVLSAVGLLLMFATLAQVPSLIDAMRDGRRIKFSKGDSSIEVSSECDKS